MTESQANQIREQFPEVFGPMDQRKITWVRAVDFINLVISQYPESLRGPRLPYNCCNGEFFILLGHFERCKMLVDLVVPDLLDQEMNP